MLHSVWEKNIPKQLNDGVGAGKNKYKFRGFLDRIEAIDIDIHRDVDGLVYTLGDKPASESQLGIHASFFTERLFHWKMMDTSIHFKQFLSEMMDNENPIATSLPLVLLHKEKISRIIVKHLMIPGSLAVTALVDLIAVLAKDLRSEFYPECFQIVCKALIEILDPKFPKLVEVVFECLGYLFKFLTKQIVKDIRSNFSLFYFELLSHKKFYVRRFAAESFSYLLRKVQRHKIHGVLEYIINYEGSDVSNHFEDGLATLLVDTIRGVQHGFHSCMEYILPFYIKAVTNHDDLQIQQRTRSVMISSFHKLNEHTRSDFCQAFFSLLIETSKEQIEYLAGSFKSNNDGSAYAIGTIISIVNVWCKNRKGTRIIDESLIFSFLSQLIELQSSCGDLSQETGKHTLELVLTLWKVRPNILAVRDQYISSSLVKMMRSSPDLTPFISFFQDSAHLDNFDRLGLQAAITYTQLTIDSSTSEALFVLLKCLDTYESRNQDNMILRSSLRLNDGKNPVIIFAKRWIIEFNLSNDEDVFKVWGALKVFSLGSRNDQLKYIEHLWKLADSARNLLHAIKDVSQNLVVAVFLQALKIILVLYSNAIDDLEKHRLNESISFICILLKSSSSSEIEILLMDCLQLMIKMRLICSSNNEIFPLLRSKLASPNSSVRKKTISLLVDSPNIPLTANHQSWVGSSEILEQMRKIIYTIPSLESEREMILSIRRIEEMTSSGLFPVQYTSLVPNFLLGCLYIKFQPLWRSIVEVLGSASLLKFSNLSSDFGQIFIAFAKRCEVFHSEHTKIDLGITEDLAVKQIKELLLPSTDGSCTDTQTYFACLLECIARGSAEFRQSIQHIVLTSFSKFIHHEHDRFYAIKSSKGNSLSIEETSNYEEDIILEDEISDNIEEEFIEDNDSDDKEEGASKIIYNKLILYLDIIEKYSNTPAYSEELLEILLRLISKKDVKVQQSSIRCLKSWKFFSCLEKYDKDLLRLCTSGKDKESLTAFRLDEVNEFYREQVSELAIRILVPKILSPGGKHKSKERAPFLNWIAANLDGSENATSLLLNLVLTPVEDKSLSNINVDSSFLHLMSDLLHFNRSLLSSHMYRFFDDVCKLIIKYAPHDLTPRSQRIRNVLQLSLRIFSRILETFAWYDWKAHPSFSEALNSLQFMFQNLSSQNIQHVSGVWKLIESLSNLFSLQYVFKEYDVILENVVDCVSVISIHPSVLHSAYKVILNLLSPIVESISEEKETFPHFSSIKSITPRLLSRIVSRREFLPKHYNFGRQELKLLSQLLEFIEPSNEEFPKQCVQFLNILSQHFISKSLDLEQKVEILELIQKLSNVSSLTSIEVLDEATFLKPLVKQFLILPHENEVLRSKLAEILSSLLGQLPEVNIIIECDSDKSIGLFEVLIELHAMETHEITPTYDFERRFGILNSLDKLSSFKVSSSFDPGNIQQSMVIEQLLMSIIFSLMHYVKDSELMIRRGCVNALHSISVFLEEQQWLSRRWISDIILPFIIESLRTSDESSRREFVQLLKILSVSLDKHPQLKELTHLFGVEDKDSSDDLLTELVHIQHHHKRKALARVNKLLDRGIITEWLSSNVLVPLVEHILTPPDFSDEKNTNIVAQSLKKHYDRVHDLVEEAMRVFARLSSILGWVKYSKVVRRLTSRIVQASEEDPDTQSAIMESLAIWKRISVRSLCLVLDNFHFNVEENDSLFNILTKEFIPNLFQVLDLDGAKKGRSRKDQAASDSDSVATSKLRTKVIVSTALIRLLKQLPKSYFEKQMPRIVTSITRLCGSSAQPVRDQARQTLCSITETLGSEYFGFVVNELRHNLTKDYQLHVQGYLLNTLLFHVQKIFSQGSLDYCLKDILSVLLDFSFGICAAQRSSDHVKKIREMDSEKVTSGFEIIGSLIDFRSSASRIMEQLGETMSQISSPSSLSVMVQILHRLCIGLKNNSSATCEDLIVFAFLMVSSNFKHVSQKSESVDDSSQSDNRKMKDQLRASKLDWVKVELLPPKINVGLEIDQSFSGKWQGLYTESVHKEAFMFFGLELMYQSFRYRWEDCVSLAQPTPSTFYDPVMKLLFKCTNTSATFQSTKLLTMILKVLIFVLRLPNAGNELPTLMRISGKFANLIISNATSTSSQDLSRVCFEAIAQLMRSCESFKLSPSHLLLFVKLIEQDMYDINRHSVAFPLLKAIIYRKFVVSEIYDLMDKVQELLVQSAHSSIQKSCMKVLTQFLMDYPMKEKRRDHHINFIVNNLRYEHIQGRRATLDVMTWLITKLPEPMLDSKAQLFFLPLFLRLVNESDHPTSVLVRQALSSLMLRVSSGERTKILNMSFNWLDRSRPSLLRQGGYNFLSLAMETLGKDCPSDFIKSTVNAIVNEIIVLKDAFSRFLEEDDESENTSDIVDEESSHLDWRLLNCVLSSLEIYITVCIETSASVFANIDLHELIFALIYLGDYPKVEVRGRLLLVIGSMIKPLSKFLSDESDDALAYQVCMLGASHLQIEQDSIWSPSDRSEIWKNTMFAYSSYLSYEESLELCNSLCHRARHSYGRHKKLIVLELLEGLWRAGKWIKEDELLQSGLEFCYRLSSMTDSEDGAIEIKEKASQVLILLENRLGEEKFLEKYNMARSAAAKAKKDRRKAEMLQNVLDPELAAKKKKARNLKKHQSRKRKVEEMRAMRKGHAPEAAKFLAKKRMRNNSQFN